MARITGVAAVLVAVVVLAFACMSAPTAAAPAKNPNPSPAAAVDIEALHAFFAANLPGQLTKQDVFKMASHPDALAGLLAGLLTAAASGWVVHPVHMTMMGPSMTPPLPQPAAPTPL